MSFESGFLVTDNVRLLRCIGEGGMGSVWVAEHLTLDTEVAVKFMAPELATHPDAVARFTREAKAAARMRSPHVVRMFDYGVTKEGGIPFMTMELLEGEDLEERVSRAGPLSIEETSLVVTQLAKALGEAHALGIVHRDVKPDNVFLMSSGDELFVKVLDFGIAKQAGRTQVNVTCSGTTIGTPIYMSPEQILSAKDVDYRCDLWSLAVVTYFCLTGRVPFEGETFGAVCIAIDRGNMKMPSALRSEVSPELDEWFSKALARDIDRRFQSVKEMTEAFVAAASGVSPSSRVLSFALTIPRFSARMPRLPRQRTLVGGMITAPPRSAARARLGAIASAAAVLFLALGAADLGRIWFGRPADARALVASPSLAQISRASAATPPPVIDVRSANLNDRVQAEPNAPPQMVTVAPDSAPSLVASPTRIVPAARAVSAKAGTNWSRRVAAKPARAMVANAVAATDDALPSASVAGDSPPTSPSAAPRGDRKDDEARDRPEPSPSSAPTDDESPAPPPPAAAPGPVSQVAPVTVPASAVRPHVGANDRSLGL